MRRSEGVEARVIGQSPGNPYSVARKITLAAATDTFNLTCNQVVTAPVFVASTFCKEMKVPSAKLSRFLHQPTTLNAAVILPASYYRQPTRRYPVLFTMSFPDTQGGKVETLCTAPSGDPGAMVDVTCVPLFGDVADATRATVTASL